MPDLFVFILNIFLLILLSAFFSSSETALTAVSEARIHESALQGNKKASTIEKILAKKEKMISTILIGNNLVNIVVSVYATDALHGGEHHSPPVKPLRCWSRVGVDWALRRVTIGGDQSP